MSTKEPPRIVQAIAITASTGGTEALKRLLSELPDDMPPILLVQHMTTGFSKHFALHLAEVCAMRVREATDGERVWQGTIYLAPGDFHMEVVGSGRIKYVKLHKGEFVHGVRPAADPLFASMARAYRDQAIGVVLTGMGRDGTAGLLEMRAAGSYVFAQSEATCVVYGMPRSAVESGAVDCVADLADLAALLRRRSGISL